MRQNFEQRLETLDLISWTIFQVSQDTLRWQQRLFSDRYISENAIPSNQTEIKIDIKCLNYNWSRADTDWSHVSYINQPGWSGLCRFYKCWQKGIVRRNDVRKVVVAPLRRPLRHHIKLIMTFLVRWWLENFVNFLSANKFKFWSKNRRRWRLRSKEADLYSAKLCRLGLFSENVGRLSSFLNPMAADSLVAMAALVVELFILQSRIIWA